MPLQETGEISIEDIVGEFGGVAPHALTEYYGVASVIPESGPIAIQDFYGTADSVFDFVSGDFTPGIFGATWVYSTAGSGAGGTTSPWGTSYLQLKSDWKTNFPSVQSVNGRVDLSFASSGMIVGQRYRLDVNVSAHVTPGDQRFYRQVFSGLSVVYSGPTGNSTTINSVGLYSVEFTAQSGTNLRIFCNYFSGNNDGYIRINQVTLTPI